MGIWDSTSDLTPFEVRNPATDEVIATIRPHDPTEIESLVDAASKAQAQWSGYTVEQRSAALRAAGAIIRENMGELAALESRENGKPLDQAAGDVGASIALWDTFAGFVIAERGQVRRTAFSMDVAERVPFGVVAAVIPFNWPPIHTAGKLAPALAAGNGVILKPGEQCPLVATRIVELVADAFPPGLVSVVQGGADQVRTLIEHPAIRMVGFTGSPRAGTAITEIAARSHTPTLMELGGKDAIIVLEDADIAEAAAWAVDGAFFNQGESCTAASRLLVHDDIYDVFMTRFVELVSALRVGAGDDSTTQVGPMVDRRHQQRVVEHIEIGRSEGATIRHQTEIDAAAEPFASGYFVAPTIFEADPTMHVAREEIFGPVVTVLRFSSDDEAVHIANDTDYGLIAGVFSADTTRAIRLADRLDVGMTLINNYHRGVLGSPFGGTKASGYGREHCRETLAEYSYAKLIRIPSGHVPVPRWGVDVGH